MRVVSVAIAFALLLVQPGARAVVEAGGTEKSCCKPAVREVSEEVIVAEIGGWRLELKVALIGCKDDLLSMSDEDLRRIEAEFREPTLWSNLTLIHRDRDVELRRTASRRINQLVGKPVVSDVLLYDLALYDDIR